MDEFKINQKLLYNDNTLKVECIIVSIIKEMGPSILNHKMATMDLVYTTYYLIKLNDGTIYKVSKHFLEEI